MRPNAPQIVPSLDGMGAVSSQDFVKGGGQTEVSQRGPSADQKSPSGVQVQSPVRVWGHSPQKPEITVKNHTENSFKYNTNNKL